MTLRWIVGSVHLLALGIGLGAIVARAYTLRRASREPDLRAAFLADTYWGLAAVLWIGTGVWRAFGGLEKGTAYYLGNGAFRIKLGLLALILLLEILPLITLIRWRIRSGRREAIDLGRAPLLGAISIVQALLVVAMIFAASAMARGLG